MAHGRLTRKVDVGKDGGYVIPIIIDAFAGSHRLPRVYNNQS
jgi:hypothetical protein